METVNLYYMIQQRIEPNVSFIPKTYWVSTSGISNSLDGARKVLEEFKRNNPDIKYRIIEVRSTVVE